MKNNLILIILWSLGIISCTSQKQKNSDFSITSSSTSLIEVPKDSTCCFDIKKYDERRIKEGHYDFDFTENDKNIRQRYNFSSNSEEKYIEEISKKWSPFNIQKRYNNLGRLKFWGMFFRNEGINKSYEYDENGKVIKVTDYEKKFRHSFADIREFLLKEKGIDIYDTRQAIARRVYHKNENSREVYYDIHVRDKSNEEKDYKIIIFDDTLELKEYH